MNRIFSGLLLAFVLSFGNVVRPVFSIAAKAVNPADAPVSVPDKIDLSYGYADLVEKLLPTVVNISVSGTKEITVPSMGGIFGGIFSFGSPFDDEGQQVIKRETTSLGSGFIIDKSGLVVTNYHVIKDADKIIITTHDGSEFRGKVIGKDENMDIALVKVDAKQAMPFVKLGDSTRVRIGDKVIAIGNPMGLGGTVTSGMVSAKARCVDSSAPYAFIQTDAVLNHGSSGGPMFNLKGEVIGMNTAMLGNSRGGLSVGFGFAIPADVIESTVVELKQGRSVDRPWLGIAYRPMDEKFAAATGAPDARGIMVHSVVKDSPADKAGVKPDDVIVSFNGKKLSRDVTLAVLLTRVKIGQDIPMLLWRCSTKKFVEVKIAMIKRPKSSDASAKTVKVGNIVVGTLDSATIAKLNNQSNIKITGGVIVKQITKRDNGLQDLLRNDVIIGVNGRQIMSPADFKKVVQQELKTSHQGYALFRIIRNGASLSLPVQIKN